MLFSHTGQAWNRKLITPSLYSQSIIYGKENYIQRKLVQWLSFFLPVPQAVTKQGSSFSHGCRQAQESHCHWMYSLRRNLAAAQEKESLETRPIIWVSFIIWSFWIHSKISHLKRGWQWELNAQMATEGMRGRKGGGKKEENLLVVSFTGTNLQADTSVFLKSPWRSMVKFYYK